MIPYELKIDKDGLLYLDDDGVISNKPLLLDTREFIHERYYPCEYLPIYSSSDYIVKYCYTVYTRKEIKAIKEMLTNLIEKQSMIPNVDFPIAYYKHSRKLAGLVIKYYKDSMSYDHLLDNHDMNELGKYYAHDEDNLHNMFLMLSDVLDLVYEMFENGVYYSGIYPDNIILTDNKVKLIDFDYRHVNFTEKDEKLQIIMRLYKRLLNEVLRRFELSDGFSDELKNFGSAKTFTKKLENKIRKD